MLALPTCHRMPTHRLSAGTGTLPMVLSLVLWRAWSAAANCPSIDSQPPTADSEREVFAVPEEYVEMVQCWGQDYIFSRVRATGDGGCHDQTDVGKGKKFAGRETQDGWCTRVRHVILRDEKVQVPAGFEPQNGTEPGGDDAGVAVIGTYKSPLSHNLAAMCVDNDKMLLVGGQYKPAYTQLHWQGIRMIVVDSKDQLGTQLTASSSRASNIIATGNSSENHCTERFYTQGYHNITTCEFDGKLSLARMGRRLFLFARANLGRGIRSVQVSSSAIRGREQLAQAWSPFELIRIRGFNTDRSSLYFFHVEGWNETHSVAFFPATLKQFGSQELSEHGVFRSFSDDMLHWSAPQLLRVSHAEDEAADDFLPSKNAMRSGRGRYFPVALVPRTRKLVLTDRCADSFAVTLRTTVTDLHDGRPNADTVLTRPYPFN